MALLQTDFQAALGIEENDDFVEVSMDAFDDDICILEEESVTNEGTSAIETPSAHPDITRVFPDLMPLLHQISAKLPEFDDETSSALYALIDHYSEADWTGFTDLMALYGELLSQLEDMNTVEVARQLSHAFITYLQTLELEQRTSMLTLMQDSMWNEPVAAEDITFLQDLLEQERARLVAADLAEMPSDSDEHVSILPSPPTFCDIDFSLLQEEGPQVEPAVMSMMSESLGDLKSQWQNNADDLLDRSIASLETVARALGTVSLLGAKLLVDGLSCNMRYLAENHIPLLEDKHESVIACIDGLLEYCSDISLYENQQTLLDQFIDTQLPVKPNTEQASFLMGLLALASLQSNDDVVQETAAADDVVLHESDAIDPQLLDMLHNELPALSDSFLDNVQNMRGATGNEHTTALAGAQRSVHTLKGLANMAGIRGLANLAHRVEDVLDFLSDASLTPSMQLNEDLLEAADCIAAMSESVTEGAPAPDSALRTLQTIMDWDYRLKTVGADALTNDTSVKEQLPSEDKAVQAPAANANVNVEAEPSREEVSVFRVQRSILDNLFRLAGESSTINTQLEEELTLLRSSTRMNRERHRNLQRVMFELEQQVAEKMSMQPQLEADSSDFDPLEMDRYNELHTTISRVQEAVADVRELNQDMEKHIQSLGTLHIAQSGLQKETLDNVLSTRLVEARTLTSRLQRILRQACRATGKQAELIIQGEDTLVDSHILNQLADPLMHIIRNAVDHGLESERLRVQRGKPTVGKVTLTYSLRDDQVEVICEDDGDGINTQRVLAVAEEKELIEPDVELNNDDIHRLILAPGFSTRDEVSQLSGRGIGMDVVYQQILRLQGTLDISSVNREGTRLYLSMPASSLMIRTLLVRSGAQVFALSGHGVEQSLLSLDGKLTQQDGQLQFNVGEDVYPAFALENLLDKNSFNYLEDGAVFPVLIVNLIQGERVAVVVREILAHRELAFKQMGDFIPEIPGIPGLTILANGETAPIIDLPSRIRFKRTALSEKSIQFDSVREITLPKLLVVDDSLSARKTLAMLLEDSGYEVMTAIDGLDALNQVRKNKPDVVLTDMEMPRMGGVELASVLKNRAETQDVPVIMITSRSTEKHRQEAEAAGIETYLTKPWTENQLLDEVESLLMRSV